MTTADDEGALERLRHAFAKDTAPAGADCPSPDRIWEAMGGDLDPADVAIVVDHVSSCGACAEAWRLARELKAIETTPAVIPFAPRRRAPIAWRLLAVAATIVLAVAAWQLLRQPAPPQTVSTPSMKPEQTIAAVSPSIEKAPIMLSAARALVFRSKAAADPFVDEFAVAIEPYKKDDYAEAVTRLDALARKYPEADEPPFYLGVSLLLSARRADAIPPLQRAAKGRDQAIAEQARRYLAIATAK